MKPTLFISFGRRYWPLLVVFAVLVILGRIDAVTYFVGPIFYLIEMVVGSMVAAVFVKHVFFQSTVDTYTNNDDDSQSEFVKHWISMSTSNPDLKIFLTFVTLWILYLGAAWIAANIVK